MQDLVNELKDDFWENNCISANDSSDLVSIKLNTLENKNNNIRAVFAVAKLNEGWDVLNLFDIVRLYWDDWITANRSNVIDKKTWKVKSWPQTVAEAQLIWRWARYFPFSSKNALWEDKYKRKFDDKNDELKILETFYYHTFFDSLYITEIKQALRDTWMLDEIETKSLDLKFKDSFKKSNFYKNWVIFTNIRVLKDCSNNDSLEQIWIKCESFDYNILTWKSDDIKVFEDKKSDMILERSYKTYILKTIDQKIIKKAIQKNDFFKFNNLRWYFPKLKSIDNFIESDDYLWNIKINISSSDWIVYNLLLEDKLKSILALLQYLQWEIKDKKIEFEWSKEFKSKAISKYDFEKSIKIDLWVAWFWINKDWFVFEEINWSSEEINFIWLFEKKINELSEKYDEIYLIRNERTIAIYSFLDWDRFEPDFLLFMKDKENKKPITYQIFIEPKWSHLLENDKWKEDFLNQIEEKAEIIEINLWNYKLVLLPFYNTNKEIEFEKSFDERF